MLTVAGTAAVPTLANARVGKRASISEIAGAEKLERTYVGAVLRLMLLAPDIVRAIVDGRQPPDLTLPRLLEPWPVEWEGQRAELLAEGAIRAVPAVAGACRKAG